FADVVERRSLIVDGREADQRFLGRALLDQYGAPVRQVAGEVRTGANELAPRPIERCQPLGHGPVLHAMDDAKHLDATTVPVCNGAVVVTCGERLVHALEPPGGAVLDGSLLCRLFGRCDAGHSPGERQAGETPATARWP